MRVVLITGTRREPKNHSPVYNAVRRADLVIVGDAPGVDALTRRVCEAEGVKAEVFKADWSEHGRAAGPLRNAAMVERCMELHTQGHSVECWALPDKESRGTWDCLKRAVTVGIVATVVGV